MPALNFQARFADDVEAGRKRCTIRAQRKDGRQPAHVGEPLKLYTGMRTKACRLLREVTPKRVRRIVIDTQYWTVSVDGIGWTPLGIMRLARRDGFDMIGDFYRFFRRGKDVFVGWLIEW